MSKKLTIIGANGKSGRKIVDLGLKKGFEVRSVTRKGFDGNISSSNSYFKNICCDITKLSVELNEAIQGSDAVIFAASASSKGGNAQQVDKGGLINVARLCIDNKVPRLVIISSGAVTKPYSLVYLFLNLFGGIMTAKAQGENAVIDMYNQASDKKIGYTIIRPGGLTEEPPVGCNDIELNQGDNVSGRISRWDVASLCVECIETNEASRTIFECYQANTAQPLANVGFSNLFKRTNPDGTTKTGFERRGSTWKQLFEGLSKTN